MILFYSDLDNTLIYSYKHNIGKQTVPVEIYKERETSFMTENSARLLKKITKNILFVPVTTRTIEQYSRIDLHIGTPQFALTCNGGILLEDGIRDDEWYNDSLKMIYGSNKELNKAVQILETDGDRSLEVRFIEDLFVFTKSDDPLKSIQILKDSLDLSVADVFNNGVKVYVLPKQLNKGIAIRRLSERITRQLSEKQLKTIAAGDSEFDVSMLKEADVALMPESLNRKTGLLTEQTSEKTIVSFDDTKVFSDGILEYIQMMTDKSTE